MKKMILGAVIGAIIVLLFIFLGGGKYVSKFGVETERVGKRLQKVEGLMKKSAKEMQKKAGKTATSVKKSVESTTEKVREKVESATEKVNKFID